MTIQREYTLPNCKLLVQGLAANAAETTNRPLMSVVTNVECRFVGHDDAKITGGRLLLETLATAVSQYAQSLLSGIAHPMPASSANATDQPEVALEQIEPDVHQLTVRDSGQSRPTQISLGTVELFDLVEAIDQLLTDAQTLPDLALSLTPVSRRYAQTQEPLSKRVIPAAVGVAGLAVAALALFFLPIPERREDPTPEPAAQEAPADPTAGASPLPGASPSPAATPEAESDVPLNEAIATTSVITDPDTLAEMEQQLRDQLDDAWERDTADLPENLIYRVRTAENGDILGFRYINDAAIENLEATPLRDLQYNPTDEIDQEPSAQFEVIFTPDGAIEVSPWEESDE